MLLWYHLLNKAAKAKNIKKSDMVLSWHFSGLSDDNIYDLNDRVVQFIYLEVDGIFKNLIYAVASFNFKCGT